MADPNARYKSSFAALTEKLGRVPDSRDKEWLELHEEYKRAWAPAVEPQRRRPGLEGSSAPAAIGTESVRAREADGEAMSGPGIIAESVPDRTTPDERNGASRITEGATGGLAGFGEGDRGPSGGLVSVCQSCARLWERPARRGRPAKVCGECGK